MKKKYLICYAGTAAELTQMVNERLDEGFEPIGGVVIVTEEASYVFYQALFRYGRG